MLRNINPSISRFELYFVIYLSWKSACLKRLKKLKCVTKTISKTLKDVIKFKFTWFWISSLRKPAWPPWNVSVLYLLVAVCFAVRPQSRHNMSAPDWVTPAVMEKLRFLKDFGFQVEVVSSASCFSPHIFGRSIDEDLTRLWNVECLQLIFGVHKQQEKCRLQGGKYI